ncbi:UDP-glycosyltransferase 88F5-like [Prosopis cineraria]|uniref:UDP-glycosyltransferase 88F5-like n=1 Tax=Prosopis cineraria TaxID=364024 RepID=UPI00240F9B3E|nr:UDP-glycosyltransferase 88F5-like [Prosopis cineraria]
MEQTIVLYPAPGIGHIVSMVELGKLLLLHHSNSFSITILLTTGLLDKPYLDSYIRRISHSYPSISFRRFPFLAVKPPAVASSHPSPSAIAFEFIRLNDANVASALKDVSEKSNIQAFVIDLFCTSAMNIGSSLGIPVYYFFTSGAAVLSAFSYFPRIHEQTTKSFKDLSVDLHFPANPPLKAFHMVEPTLDRDDPAYWDFLNFCSHLPKSSGIVVNTFQELEPVAVKAIAEGKCFPDPKQAPPVYYIGPLIAEPNDRIEDEGEGEHRGRIENCLSWLEKQPSRSVVYLCFGSRGSMSVAQLKEIAHGLERSEQRFLWVVKKPPSDERTKQTEDTRVDFDLDKILPSGFMERTRDRGMVVRSWAPQVEVLRRESVGGFVTHCGWNSVLEAVVAGVPLIAWPLYAEQHMNRNLLVEEMKMAIGLEHREEDGFVKGEELEKKVRELMESEGGREMRARSLKRRELAESARGTLGSSTKALNNLVESWSNGR